MKLLDMFDQCVQSVQSGGADAIVIFKINRKARGQRIRLTPRNGPYGEIVQAGDDMTVGAFRAAEVVEWIKRIADEGV